MKLLNKKANFIALTSLIILITFIGISMNGFAQFTSTFTSPTSGTHWNQGDTVHINWTSTLTGSDSIDLRLYRDSVGVVIPIETGMLNNESYTWTIPANIENANDYKIQMRYVQVLPGDDVIWYWYSDAFTIGTVSAAIPGYPALLLIGCSLIFTIGFAVYLLKKRSISSKV